MLETLLRKPLFLAAAMSVPVGIAVMVIKYIAYLATGSVAFYSDALESIVNVAVGIAALVAIVISSKPADREHPYGHHKAEFFSAVLEGALIIVAALLIFREAWHAMVEPRSLTQPILGMAINGLATALNAGWSWFLITRGRKWRSPALVADGWHLMTDVWTSVGVLAGIALATATGWSLLDPLLAIAVAINVLWMGYRIASSALSGLMDEAVSPEVQRQIEEAIRDQGSGALQAHDIRTRHVGRATFIEFHLVVPGGMTVNAAHDICDRIEAGLKNQLPGSDITIHLEPEEKAKSRARGAVPI